MKHAAIIEALGDYEEVGREVGVHGRRVHHWKTLGIPVRHWMAVAALAERKGVAGVTFEGIAASHPRPSKEAEMARAAFAAGRAAASRSQEAA